MDFVEINYLEGKTNYNTIDLVNTSLSYDITKFDNMSIIEFEPTNYNYNHNINACNIKINYNNIILFGSCIYYGYKHENSYMTIYSNPIIDVKQYELFNKFFNIINVDAYIYYLFNKFSNISFSGLLTYNKLNINEELDQLANENILYLDYKINYTFDKTYNLAFKNIPTYEKYNVLIFTFIEFFLFTNKINISYDSNPDIIIDFDCIKKSNNIIVQISNIINYIGNEISNYSINNNEPKEFTQDILNNIINNIKSYTEKELVVSSNSNVCDMGSECCRVKKEKTNCNNIEDCNKINSCGMGSECCQVKEKQVKCSNSNDCEKTNSCGMGSECCQVKEKQVKCSSSNDCEKTNSCGMGSECCQVKEKQVKDELVKDDQYTEIKECVIEKSSDNNSEKSKSDSDSEKKTKWWMLWKK